VSSLHHEIEEERILGTRLMVNNYKNSLTMFIIKQTDLIQVNNQEILPSESVRKELSINGDRMSKIRAAIEYDLSFLTDNFVAEKKRRFYFETQSYA
jgi:hypothetical protein